METIGKRISTTRKLLNMKQKELSAKANISEASLSRYESDERIPKTQALVKISNVLNVSVDYLLGKDDTYDKPKVIPSSECINLEEIGRRIINARVKMNLKQNEVADLISTTKTSMSRYERGLREIRVGTLVELSQILNTPLHYLLGVDDPKLDNRLCDTTSLPNEAIFKINEYIELLKLKYKNVKK